MSMDSVLNPCTNSMRLAMAGRSFLWTLVVFHQYLTVFISGYTYPTLTQLCPAQTFCHSNATKVFSSPKFESCCQACSCREDCSIVGNCCPDVDIADEAMSPVIPCTDIVELLNANRISGIIDFGTRYYRLITTCPTKAYVDNEMAGLCEQPRELNDYIPVSSLDGNMLFQNEHCARCNGQLEYIAWDIFVAYYCPDLFNREFNSIEERDEYILQTCQLMAHPKSNLPVQSTRCYGPPTFEVCNMTGMWDVYDADIETACNTERRRANTIYSTVEESNPHYSEVTFANIYCYYCNSRIGDIAIQQQCLASYDPQVHRHPEISMLVLLDTRDNVIEKESNYVRGNDRCPGSSQIYDKYTGYCRQVVCGLGMMPVLDSCQPLGRSSGVAIRTLFVINNLSAQSGYMGSLREDDWLMRDGESLVDIFVAQLGSGKLLNCVVIPCHTNCKTTTSGSIYFDAVFASSDACPLHMMLASLGAIVDKDLVLQMPTTDKHMNVNVRLQIEPETNFEGSQYIGHSSLNFCDGVISLSWQLLETCSRFRLHDSELEHVGLFKESISSLKDASIDGLTGLTVNESFTICISQYDATMQRFVANNGNIDNANYLFRWMVLALIISILTV